MGSYPAACRPPNLLPVTRSRVRGRHAMHKRIVNKSVIEIPRFSLFLPRRDWIVRRPLVEHVPLVWRDEHAVAEAGEQPAGRASTLILEALSGYRGPAAPRGMGVL